MPSNRAPPGEFSTTAIVVLRGNLLTSASSDNVSPPSSRPSMRMTERPGRPDAMLLTVADSAQVDAKKKPTVANAIANKALRGHSRLLQGAFISLLLICASATRGLQSFVSRQCVECLSYMQRLRAHGSRVVATVQRKRLHEVCARSFNVARSDTQRSALRIRFVVAVIDREGGGIAGNRLLRLALQRIDRAFVVQGRPESRLFAQRVVKIGKGEGIVAQRTVGAPAAIVSLRLLRD